MRLAPAAAPALAALAALAGCGLLFDADRLSFPHADGGCPPLACAGRCGPLSDACGGATDCGGCAAPDTCGGGGLPGECGCDETDGALCRRLGRDCGPHSATDLCGRARAVDCGRCAGGTECGLAGAGVCGCGEGTCTQPGRTACREAWRACTCETCGWLVATRPGRGHYDHGHAVAVERSTGWAAQIAWVVGAEATDTGVWWARWPAAGPEPPERVDAPARAGESLGLALDADERPSLSWLGSGETLRYGRRVNGVWHAETVDGGGGPVGHAGWYSSLVLDAAGAPRIAYEAWDGTTATVRIARRTGPERWERQVVAVAKGFAREVRLATQADGTAHVAWVDAGAKAVMHARESAEGWVVETVEADAEGALGTGLALAVGADGAPQLVYDDLSRSPRALRHARWTGHRWAFERLDELGAGAVYAGLAVDQNGTAHIGSVTKPASARGELRYLRRTGDGWARETIPTGRNADWTARLALDARGYPVLFFGVSGEDAQGLARWGPGGGR